MVAEHDDIPQFLFLLLQIRLAVSFLSEYAH